MSQSSPFFEQAEATQGAITNLDTQIETKERELKELKTRRERLLGNDSEEKLRREAPATSQLIAEAMRIFSLREEGKEKPIPLPWLSVANNLGGGLWPGLHILVGNTGSGKSQWALQTAHHAARQGQPVLYIALELGAVDLVARLLGFETGIRWSDIWHGKTDALNQLRATEAIERVKRLPIHQAVVPPYGWSYDGLKGLVEAMTQQYAEAPPPFVILDFMQLVSAPQGIREDLRERIQKTAYAARYVAREMACAVLVVSSTSRDNYTKLDGGEPIWKASATVLQN